MQIEQISRSPLVMRSWGLIELSLFEILNIVLEELGSALRTIIILGRCFMTSIREKA
jgi:hypothetical protein